MQTRRSSFADRLLPALPAIVRRELDRLVPS